MLLGKCIPTSCVIGCTHRQHPNPFQDGIINAALSSVKEMAATEMSLASEELVKQTSLTAGMKNGQQKWTEEHTFGTQCVK